MVVGTFGVLMSIAFGYMLGRKEERKIGRSEAIFWKNKYETIKNDVKESKNDDNE